MQGYCDCSPHGGGGGSSWLHFLPQCELRSGMQAISISNVLSWLAAMYGGMFVHQFWHAIWYAWLPKHYLQHVLGTSTMLAIVTTPNSTSSS